ncbi:predicted protein [Nematostella vectensis]|uniref:Uncharacterized protein n=1 Tax=Nematostella vectensis TaxID=45351 RepID=A7RQ40_NEMVE|nr:predicted protein [Nematostella vectensis]|eukprot:XP_001638491.1 predicted protein [Nematostella vectensis]
MADKVIGISGSSVTWNAEPTTLPVEIDAQKASISTGAGVKNSDAKSVRLVMAFIHFRTDQHGRAGGDVSIDYIIKNCAAFKNGGCPYKDERLKGLAGKCPMFRDSKGNFICPFKERAANTYELRALMLEMKEKCPAKAAYSKFFQALMKINEKTAAKIGHCPYHQKGCKVNNIPVFDHSVAKWKKEDWPIEVLSNHAPMFFAFFEEEMISLQRSNAKEDTDGDER